MEKPSPSIRAMARQLLALEAASQRAADAPESEGASVCEKLRLSLSRLAGPDSFASLLRRALVLSQMEVPSLSSITIRPDCSLDGFEKLSKEDAAAAAAALNAYLLWLLVTFIGETLTMRLVRQAWPGAGMDEEAS